ncbi:hypothetical protein, partial [Bilophila wadsworthia]|uniref:hypothetical protein n=1 Tax=Bilophila wadsworthia TaxID=35833 RepID=UPI002666069C
DSITSKVFEDGGVGFGEGRKGLSGESPFLPSPNPPPPSSKTFGLIESLFTRFLKHGRGIHTFNENDNITC